MSSRAAAVESRAIDSHGLKRWASFWALWVAANALSELVGLGSIAFLGFMLAERLGEITSVAMVLAVVTVSVLLGAGEGALVGAAQGVVLRTRLPGIPIPTWSLATAIGAALAWLLGMTPSTAIQLAAPPGMPAAFEPPPLIEMALAATLGLIAGVILAVPQWRVLRRFVARASWWLLANALAWMAAMPVVFAAADLVPPDGSPTRRIATLLGAVFCAGAVAGAVHGAFLVALLRRNRV